MPNLPGADFASGGRNHGEWLWVEERITSLLDSHDDACLFDQGCVRNQAKFYDRFDAVALLSALLTCSSTGLRAGPPDEYGKTQVVSDLIAIASRF